MVGELKFRVSSGLKSIIGKDLITDEFIAVFELVKNSYDAYAQKVVITIEEDRLIIADDGKGMSLEDIKDKWLFVAYSAKKDKTEDKNHSYRDEIIERKHYAGSKGVGRFSSDRLGELLDVYTKTQKARSFEHIAVDWSDFEKDQKDDFGLVSVKHSRTTELPTVIPNNAGSGTILEIKKLSKNWSRDDLLKLRHSLEKLINPFSGKDDFSVEIVCDNEKEEDENGFHKKGILKGEKYLPRFRVNGLIKNAIQDILELKTSKITLRLEGDKE